MHSPKTLMSLASLHESFTVDEEVGAIFQPLGVLADDMVQPKIQLVVSQHLFRLHSSGRVTIRLLSNAQSTIMTLHHSLEL